MSCLVRLTRASSLDRRYRPAPERAIREIPASCRGKSRTNGEAGVREKLSLDDAPADRVADEAGGVVDLELGHDPRAVGFGGLGADAEELGDLLGRLAFGDELKHLALAVGQGIARQRRLSERRF